MIIKQVRSDKGVQKVVHCDRCEETLGKARIVVTTKGADGQLVKERKRYCSQRCFDKAYRRGLAKLLP